MGLFDSVNVKCPHCGSSVELQSKADEDPYLKNFTLDTAPLRILLDVMNQPAHCMKCKGWLAVVDPRNPLAAPERPPTEVRKVTPPKTADTHSQGFQWWPDDEPFTFENLST